MPTGSTTLNFGTAASKTLDTSVAVTGQTGILAGSKVEAYMMGNTTADHSADEHVMAASMFRLTCGDVIAGTGFTIYAVCEDYLAKAGLTGQFTIQWVWS